MSQKYVPNGCYLTCDKGSSPCQLKVTHSKKATIYGENLASEADMIPGQNIFPMGACGLTNAPCQPDPLYWDKTMKAIKVNGYKLLVEDAQLLCKKGGKVSIQFTKAEAMTALGAGPTIPNGITNSMTGLGMGSLDQGISLRNIFAQGAVEAERFRTLIRLAQADILAQEQAILAQTPVPPIQNPIPDRNIKGNFGELRTAADLKMRGYDVISNTHATQLVEAGHQGLDIGAKYPHSPMDILADAKYKESAGQPTMNNTRRSGRQMSDRWLTTNLPNRTTTTRLQDALPADDAARITNKVNAGSRDLMRLAAKVEADGAVTYYEVDRLGNVGNNPIQVPPANVMSGNSRAANLINNVSRSIQSTRAVSTANQWLVRNAHHVSRVGRVVGRGLLVVGIVAEAYNISQAYQQDGKKVGRNTKQAIGSAAGALAGGIAGAKLGAMIGAIGGPVGILVGGIAGGIIGGLVGAWMGREAGGWF